MTVLGKAEWLHLYEMIQLIRRSELRLMEEYHPADEMRCPIHFCVGQETTPAALSSIIRPTDVMMTHYRSHGYFLAKGGSLDAMIAEFYGKSSGTNGGLAGSMELGSHEIHFHSGAIVGGTMSIPLGAAFAQKYRKTDDISIAVMGDGSFDEGVVYECMNLAALWKLPLLLICENNLYAAHTGLPQHMGRPDLLAKAEAMGVPGRILDGYDLPGMVEPLHMDVAAVRAGGGPRFVEVRTYRQCAHVGPTSDDDLEYRSDEELEAWNKRDVLPRLRQNLLGLELTEDDLDRIDAAIDGRIDTAIRKAKAAPFPSFDWALGTVTADTYAPAAIPLLGDVPPTFVGGQHETKLGPF